MRLMEDGIVAAFAVIGVCSTLFLLVSLLARPCRRCAGDALAVVPLRHGAEGLEDAVRRLVRARCDTGAFRRILLLDRGADGETLLLAAQLCRAYPDVELRTCAAAEPVKNVENHPCDDCVQRDTADIMEPDRGS